MQAPHEAGFNPRTIDASVSGSNETLINIDGVISYLMEAPTEPASALYKEYLKAVQEIAKRKPGLDPQTMREMALFAAFGRLDIGKL